jgi:hypothetical protein
MVPSRRTLLQCSKHHEPSRNRGGAGGVAVCVAKKLASDRIGRRHPCAHSPSALTLAICEAQLPEQICLASHEYQDEARWGRSDNKLLCAQCTILQGHWARREKLPIGIYFFIQSTYGHEGIRPGTNLEQWPPPWSPGMPLRNWPSGLLACPVPGVSLVSHRNHAATQWARAMLSSGDGGGSSHGGLHTKAS